MGVLTIWKSADYTVSQAKNVYLPGYLLIEGPSSRAAPRGSSPPDEALHHVLRMSETLVQRLIRPRRIYVLKEWRSGDRLHIHMIPGTGTEELLGSCNQSTGDKSTSDEEAIAKAVWENYAAGKTSDNVIEVLAFVSQARSLCRELLALPVGNA